jgi:DNA-binding response OmpR family regulator
MLLEWRTGLRTVQADSLVGVGGLLTDPMGGIALAVVSVDTSDGPGTGLIERMRKLGLPVLAFGSEGSTGPLAGALDAGADDAISLGAPVNYLIGKAEQLASKSASQHLS